MSNDTKQSGPVDVLAVMDAACCVLALDKYADPQRQLAGARAAVAELIKADREYDTAWADYGMAKTGTPRNEAWDRLQSAISRRKVALANVGSAS